MTTETKTGSEAAKAEEEEQSFLPTVLAGAGILAVAALLIFWPSGDDDKSSAAEDGNAKTSAVGGAGGANGAAARAAGVSARPVDAPTTPATRRRNPAIKLPPHHGMAPSIPEAAPKDPPPDATEAEKIAFYEKRLEQAIRVRDNRKKFADRLPAVKERIEASPSSTASLDTFEQRKKIVEDNYAKAEQDVTDIEAKLAALRGG